MGEDELLAEFREAFGERRFAAGLLLAFIEFLRGLGVYGRGYTSFDDLLKDYPLSDTSARGQTANTLTVQEKKADGSTRLVSIRPAYNRAERRIRVENKRFDYPNCAPHATGQWRDYRRWLDALVTMSAAEANGLAQAVLAHVLSALDSHEVDLRHLPPLERRFTRFLEGFELTRQGREPLGAAFQGAIYAYIRADAPHLHLEVARAGAGSKRLGRIGDIDGWDGARLVFSAEVKHLDLGPQSWDQVAPFLAEVSKRQALAIVAAKSFTKVAAAAIREHGGRCLDVPELLRLVDLWDPLKQRAALQAFVYYVHHVEQNSLLKARLAAFLSELDPGARPTPETV